MAGSGEQDAQQGAGGVGGIRTVVGTGATYDAERTIFSKWTSRPPMKLRCGKKALCCGMVDVLGIHHADENIDVQQRGHGLLGCIAFWKSSSSISS